MRSRFLFLLFLFVLTLSGVSLLPGQEAIWRIRMLWIPQAEFAGFYIAEAEGFYEKEGLHVILEHPKTNEDNFESLKKGQTDVVVAWPVSAMEQVVQGADIVNMGQMAQKSALMFIARKTSGIKKPKDMEGRRIGLWPAKSLQVPYRKFMEHYGIKTFEEFPVLSSVDLFLYGGVDVTVGVLYDDYYRIYGAGINSDELVCFNLSDTFKQLVDDGLYCKRSTWEKSPEDCRKILNATMEGWRHAFQDKERTLQIIRMRQEKNGVPFNIAHQRWMLNIMEKLIFPQGQINNGIFEKASFDEAADILDVDKSRITYERFVPGSEK